MIGRIGAIALLIPLLSALSSPAVPLGFRILLVALWATAIARPHWAIATLIALVPFASWVLLVTDSPPVRYAEALVLATLSGALVAAARPRPEAQGVSPAIRRTPLNAQPPNLTTPALLFCAVVVASAAVMLQVMQVGTRALWPFVRDFLVFLTRDYLVGPPGSFVGVADAALLVEGVALVFLVGRHAREHVTRPGQLLTATAIAGAGAALLTLAAWLSNAAAAQSAAQAMRLLLNSRTMVHVIDVNAAGSYFVMAGSMALGLAVNLRWTRLPRRPALMRAVWGAVAALIILCVWLTGSRTAVVAAIAGLGVVVMWVGPLRAARVPTWAIVATVAAGALVIAALALGIDPRPSASRTAARMLTMRTDFVITGLRMIQSAPIFGVGIGRYFEMSGQFMPQSIYWFYFHENAHNNLLQIGGELGLAGLAAFLWFLAAAAVRLVRGLRADAADRLLLGAVVGLGAFVATWATSHPMLVPEVAYPFWLLLGAAMARADGNTQPASTSRAPEAGNVDARTMSAGWAASLMRTLRPATVWPAVIILMLAVSVPLRAAREVATLDLTKQTFGFYGVEGEPSMRFRWTSRRATFFVPLSSRELRLPLRALHVGGNTAPTTVTIAMGGRPFHRVVLADDSWVTVHLRLPLMPGDDRFQRIDVITEPTWSPAVLSGGRSDVRVLGVQVGEVVTGP